MRAVIFIFLYVLIGVGHSQTILPDSLKVQAQSDPEFSGLIFESFKYGGGQIKMEGWSYMIRDSLYFFRIGDWKYYSKKGELVAAEYIPYDSTQNMVTINYRKGFPNFEINMNRSENFTRFEKLGTTGYGDRGIPRIFCAKSYFSAGLNRGKLKREFCKCSAFKKDSIFKKFYPSGQIKMEGYFDCGKRKGDWKWFDQKGNVKSSKEYGIDN